MLSVEQAGYTAAQFLYTPTNNLGSQKKSSDLIDLSKISFVERLPEYLMWGALAILVAKTAVDFFTRSAFNALSNLYLCLVTWYGTTLIQQIPCMQSFKNSATQFKDHNTTLGDRVSTLKDQNDQLTANIDRLEDNIKQLGSLPTEFGHTRQQMTEEIDKLTKERESIQSAIDLLRSSITTEGDRLAQLATRMEKVASSPLRNNTDT